MKILICSLVFLISQLHAITEGAVGAQIRKANTTRLQPREAQSVGFKILEEALGNLTIPKSFDSRETLEKALIVATKALPKVYYFKESALSQAQYAILPYYLLHALKTYIPNDFTGPYCTLFTTIQHQFTLDGYEELTSNYSSYLGKTYRVDSSVFDKLSRDEAIKGTELIVDFYKDLITYLSEKLSDQNHLLTIHKEKDLSIVQITKFYRYSIYVLQQYYTIATTPKQESSLVTYLTNLCQYDPASVSTYLIEDFDFGNSLFDLLHKKYSAISKTPMLSVLHILVLTVSVFLYKSV